MKKILKNSIFSVTAQIITLILQFVNRRLFVIFLDIELLGYQSLFGNVFSLLSVADLGIGNMISFHLYKELAEGNQREIGKLMYLYQWLYRIIAAGILLMGTLCSALLPWIVKTPLHTWPYLYLIYFLQLGSIAMGYLLSYRRTIYIADQKEYQCVRIDLYTSVLTQAVQLILLAVFKSYLLYLLIHLSTGLIANAVIAHKASVDYPYLDQTYPIRKTEIRQRNLFSDVKNFFVHNVCYVVYGGTDNLVISAFCGIRAVALYGNYCLLQKGVMQILFYKLLNPIQATIGSIVYSRRPKTELWEQFQVLDVFSYFFACYIGIGFLVFFQPAIQIWMGTDYLLPMSFVVTYSITIYFLAVWEIVYKYRSIFGDYAQDRNCMMISAIMNVILSIICARIWGITGVQVGTLAAFLPIAYGRIRFVVQNYFGQPMFPYIGKHLLLSSAAFGEGFICYLLTRQLPVSAAGFVMRGLAWALVPLAGNLVLYWRNPYLKALCRYIETAWLIIKNKAMKFLGQTTVE